VLLIHGESRRVIREASRETIAVTIPFSFSQIPILDQWSREEPPPDGGVFIGTVALSVFVESGWRGGSIPNWDAHHEQRHADGGKPS
jgi:hypothetical protein